MAMNFCLENNTSLVKSGSHWYFASTEISGKIISHLAYSLNGRTQHFPEMLPTDIVSSKELKNTSFS